jgi:hypothetical protein
MTDLFGLIRARWVLVVALAALGFVLVPGTTFAQDRDRTVAYLQRMKTLCEENDPATAASNEKKVSTMRMLARRIDELSVRGVDPEAIDLTEQLVQLLRRGADFVDDYGEPGKAFLSGIRDGLNDNPTRSIKEANALERQKKDLLETVSRARKRLELKYDVDLSWLR